jgi:hypothetical protein
MSDTFEVVAAILIVIGVYVLYFAAILTFLWIVWNWIILPGLPQLMAAI